jgi:hypothetical protein
MFSCVAIKTWSKYVPTKENNAILPTLKTLSLILVTVHGTVKKVRQAQSCEKLPQKKLAVGLSKPPEQDPVYNWNFPDAGQLPVLVLLVEHVSFHYPGGKELYNSVDFGVKVCDDGTTMLRRMIKGINYVVIFLLMLYSTCCFFLFGS